jgi:predicted acylesterase/phospholipase RssA
VITNLQGDSSQCRITFSMLESLHMLHPGVFKNLTVTATCRENGKTFYFDAKTTPDLDIAIASKASAALPVILQPVTIDRKFLMPGYESSLGTRQTLSFTDGGYLDNVPVSSMQNKQGEHLSNKGMEGQNLQTLALIFEGSERTEGEQSAYHDVKIKAPLYNASSWKERLIRDVVAKHLTGIATTERNTLSKAKQAEDLRNNYTHRTIPLLVEVETTDFKKAKEFQSVYVDRGYSMGTEYLKNHEGALAYRTFDRLDDLLTYVPEATKLRMHREIADFQNSIA